MVTIEDLTGIPEDKKKNAINILENLITFREEDETLSPIITGYNWYNTLINSDRIITLSHIHETEIYKQGMVNDLEELEYSPKFTLAHIRPKAGAFLHDLEFRIVDERGEPYKGLKIKDLRSGNYLDLKIFSLPLINYPEFLGAEGYLIDEDQGWELNIPFSDKIELFNLVELFLRKSGNVIYDKEGRPIEEPEEEKIKRKPWADAYAIPVLLLGKNAIKYVDELKYFTPVTKFSLIENHNEISFVINKKLSMLRNLPQYKDLLNLGFVAEICLANKPFIVNYVDKNR